MASPCGAACAANAAELPNIEAASAYRILSNQAYPAIKGIIENQTAGALIARPSSSRDWQQPELRPLFDQFYRGSNGYDAEHKIKLVNLLWDAIGSEFGGRHELYERNYAGNHEEIRLQSLVSAQRSGQMQKMQDLVDQCMADYDEQGWTTNDWVGPSSDSKRAAE